MTRIRFSIILVLSLLADTALADSLPGYYPDDFQYAGVLQRLDTSSGTIVIGGRRYSLSHRLVVHTLNTRFASTESLQAGIPVGFSHMRVGPDLQEITEIWVLPKNYPFPEQG